MLKLIFHSFPSGRAGVALLLIRLYVGIAFIQHGGGKLDDIAGFAVLALENKGRFTGKRVDLASDELTGARVAEILSQSIGKPIKYVQVPIENIRKMSEDMATMYEWFERVGYRVDTAALRREYPEVGWRTYEAWAKEQDWKAILSG